MGRDPVHETRIELPLVVPPRLAPDETRAPAAVQYPPPETPVSRFYVDQPKSGPADYSSAAASRRSW